MHVGVLQREHQVTRAAFAARFLPRPPRGCFTVNQLSKPQRETLFTDSTRSGQQQRLRQPSGGVGARQSGPNPFVPCEGR